MPATPSNSAAPAQSTTERIPATKSNGVSQSKLLLIDGHSLAYRSFYAFALSRDGGLRTSTGIPTSVSYGFTKSLLDTLAQENPTHVAIAFDTRQPTFRHEADDSYKAGRAETPDEFFEDIQNLEALLHILRLPVLKAPGFEADDIIGTLATTAPAGMAVRVLSGDRDLFQLVDDERDVKVMYMGGSYAKRSNGSAVREMDEAAVIEKLGVRPDQVVDYKALCGDSSDNIPGVKGIGAKTAVKLLGTYDTLATVYASLEDMKGAVKAKLESGKDAADHSQFMARIKVDVPLGVQFSDLMLMGFDDDDIVPMLEKLEFQSFLKRINAMQERLGGRILSNNVASTSEAPAKSSPTNSNAGDSGGDTWFFSAEDTAQQEALKPDPIQPQIVDTSEALQALRDRLKTHTNPATPVAWDTETTSLEPRDAQLVGIGCCWGSGLDEMAYIPVGHAIADGSSDRNLDCQMVLETVREILESDAYPKAFQNAKYDRLVFLHHGIEVRGVAIDTMLASYVLNPEESHKLSELSQRYLGIVAQDYGDLVPKGKTIADIDINNAADYCGMDVYSTYLLVSKLSEELAAHGKLKELLEGVEQPLEPVLAAMEDRGVRIDVDYLQEFSVQLGTDLDAIVNRAYKHAGETFNLGSPKQLSELLFDKLGLDTKKSRKTKLGYSTDAATLAKLQGAHPVIDDIVEYRTLAKLKSTYVDALPALVRSDTQRVHTDFNQAVTSTGRLSSSNPNLQNIPIRTAFSRQIRKAFIPEPGWRLVAADYSQIELRILTHLSQEPVLLEAYRNNDDVHSLTARLLLDKDTITSEERRLGKIINFGVIYGMGAQRFARETGVSSREAKGFIDRFNQRYPKVFDYLRRMEKEAIALGYVETILGRRRHFTFNSEVLRRLQGTDPDSIDLDKLKLTRFDAGSLRAAANAPIQGSSADIIKLAMVKLHDILQGYRARLLLQVHDELVFELPSEEWEELQEVIRDTMEGVLALDVPLKVDINAGANWMEAK
ncbi:MAG: DNA polymerase I [Synechococcus sp.]